MTIYRVSGSDASPVEETTFHAERILERRDLQGIFKRSIGILVPDALVLAEEYGDWEDSRRRVDLLCIDRGARLLVVELKRTEDGGHMELQAVRYASMVSEIRDVAAARQVLQFIDTGHQVWTTIHVRSANAILFRLVDMGVGVAEVCKPGNIQLLMKQTLVPRLCDCSLRQPQGREVPDWLSVRLRGWPEVRFRNVDGCEKCAKDNKVLAREAWGGYQRPTVVAEMIRPDGRYLEFVRERNPIGAWEYWRSEMGGRPIGEKIWDLVRDGVVDPFDAMRKGAKVDEAKGAKLRVVADGGAE